MVEVLGFGAVDAIGLLVATAKKIMGPIKEGRKQKENTMASGHAEKKNCAWSFRIFTINLTFLLISDPPVVLGLAALTASATGLLLVPFTVVGLVPFLAVAAAPEVVCCVAAAAAPSGLLGTAPDADAFAAVVVIVLLAAAAGTLLEDLTLFITRCEAVPGRELDPEAPADLAVGCALAAGCILVATAFGLTLDSGATGLPLALGAGTGAALFAASSGLDAACSVELSCNEVDSATAAA